ncbi:MAG: imidazolonepropionase [Candidatus Bathyarchaeota archaeon]|nr:MAG: imidazolonepropionase [Candidatus Bathyarchaeota archaeon]
MRKVAKEEANLLIEKASELLTIRGGTKSPILGKRMRDLGIIRDGAIAIRKGRVVAVGKTDMIREKFESSNIIDASKKVVMPGFVDPHTHLVFAGSREEEFEMRVEGAAYMEILQKGGGILKTVKETRKAGREELLEDCRKTLSVMLEHGTTTVEAKSGYGLTTEDELKCLEVMKLANTEHPIEIVPTFLGAHAVPSEYKNNTDGYVNLVADEMIPEVTTRKLAEFCDVFCERGVFNIKHSRTILSQGKRYGLAAKLHADEMTRFGGAELAAEMQAISASHLLFSSDASLQVMADQGVVAVLLPGASFTLMTQMYANAKRMIELGVPVALGTDYNPSCWGENQQMTIALACHQMRMTPAEAITAATINAAHAINRSHEIGSLELGKRADILVLNVPNHRFLGYRFSVNLAAKVIKDGNLVVNKGVRSKVEP